MFTALFVQLTQSEIPQRFQSLAEQAIMNSRNKVPLQEREKTELPGDFSLPDVSFTLKKILSSSNTFDIKGYAIEDRYVAIAKRKAFNINDGFAFVGIEEQKIYDMKDIVASDDKVNIYDTNELSIFDIFTNFRYIASENIHEINENYNINWDKSTSHPILKDLYNLKIGMGASLDIGIKAEFQFNNRDDIFIGLTTDFDFEAGTEIKVPNDWVYKQEEPKEIINKDIGIPRLNYNTSFVGLDISIGVFLRGVLSLKDVMASIPIGFSYFKGIKFNGHKTLEITPYTINNPDWTFSLANIPESNSLDDVVKQLNEATLNFITELKLYPIFKIEIASLDVHLGLGVKLPLEFKFKLDKEKCLMPYLYGLVNIPIYGFFEFSGIEIFNYEIMEPKQYSLLIYNYTTPEFCIGYSNKAQEKNEKMLIEAQSIGYFVNATAVNNNRYYPIDYPASFEFTAYKNELYTDELAIRPTQYSRGITKIKSLLFFEAQKEDNIKIVLKASSIKYGTLNQGSEETFTNILNEDDKGRLYNDWPVQTDKNDVYSKIGIDWKFRKSKTVLIEKIYKPYALHNTETGVFTGFQPCICDIPNNGKTYSLIKLDKQNVISIDTKAKFISQTMVGNQFKEDTYQTGCNNYVFKFEHFSASVPANVEYVVNVKCGENIETVTGRQLAKFGDSYLSTENQWNKLEANSYDFYIPENGELFVEFTITYNGNKVTRTLTQNKDDIESSIKEPSTFNSPDKTLNDCYDFKFEHAKVKTMTYVVPGEEIEDESYIISSTTIVNADGNSGTFKINFYPGDQYHVIRIVPKFASTNKKFIIITDKLSPLVSCEKVAPNCFSIPFNGQQNLIFAVRRQGSMKEEITIQYAIVDDWVGINKVLPSKGIRIDFPSMDTVYACMVPLIEGTAWVFSPFDFEWITLEKNKIDLALVKSKSKGYGYLAPILSSIKGQFTTKVNVKHLKEMFNDFVYHIVPNSDVAAIELVETGDIQYVNPQKQTARFEVKDCQYDAITFKSICKDKNGVMCEIKEEEKREGQYVLYQFPSKDGISISDTGAMREILDIPVDSPIIYYKVHEGEAKIMKTYKNEPISISAEITDYPSNRTMCIYDAEGVIVPLNHKYINDNLEEFMISIGVDVKKAINENEQTNNLYSYYQYDNNDCFSITNMSIVTKNYGNISNSLIVLPNEAEIGIKYKKYRDNKIIIICCVAAGVVLLLVGCIVGCICYKKKKRENNNNNNSENNNNNNSDTDEEVIP